MTEEEVLLAGLTASAKLYKSTRLRTCTCGHTGANHFMRSNIRLVPEVYMGDCTDCTTCERFNDFELTIERMITDEI